MSPWKERLLLSDEPEIVTALFSFEGGKSGKNPYPIFAISTQAQRKPIDSLEPYRVDWEKGWNFLLDRP